MALTQKATRPSSIVDKLHYRRLSDTLYEVESRSVTLGSHIVRRTYAGDWICDRQCEAFNRSYRCSHVSSVLRAERERVDLSDTPLFPLEMVPLVRPTVKHTGSRLEDIMGEYGD